MKILKCTQICIYRRRFGVLKQHFNSFLLLPFLEKNYELKNNHLLLLYFYLKAKSIIYFKKAPKIIDRSLRKCHFRENIFEKK